MGIMADDLRELLHRVVTLFADNGTNYALCGGWGVAFWGYPRLTTDIDLVIAENELKDACKALESVGFIFQAGRIPLPSQGIEFYRVSAMVGNEIVPLDMYPVPAEHHFLRNKVAAKWEGLSVQVLDIDDLIAMKSGSDRGKDKADIDELQRIKQKMDSGDA